MKYLIIFTVLLSAPVFAGSASDQLYNTGLLKIEALQEELSGGKLDDLSYAKRLAKIANEYMSDDIIFNGFSRDLLSIANARERNDIDQLKYEMMLTERMGRFQKELADRTAEYKAREIFIQQQARREAAERQARQNYAENPPMSPIQALIMMNVINNSANRIGNSMQPNNLQFPTRCHSSAYGNGIDTTCY